MTTTKNTLSHTMEKKEPKKSFKQPSKEEQNTDLSSLIEWAKRMGFKEVDPPKSVQVIFPPE